MDRIINMFPREQHSQIFLDMSQYLRAILAQRLVMGRDGKRCAAVEVMINTPHISELIKKGDVTGIKEAITSSGERGIQSFDVSLRDLFKSGRIEPTEALHTADSRAILQRKINLGEAVSTVWASNTSPSTQTRFIAGPSGVCTA